MHKPQVTDSKLCHSHEHMTVGKVSKCLVMSMHRERFDIITLHSVFKEKKIQKTKPIHLRYVTTFSRRVP